MTVFQAKQEIEKTTFYEETLHKIAADEALTTETSNILDDAADKIRDYRYLLYTLIDKATVI